MVVLAAGLIGGFLERSAAEFRGPDDEGIVQHAALFQVSEQTGDGKIHIFRQRGVGVHVAM